jgi:Tfp pilus assembly protein FimT
MNRRPNRSGGGFSWIRLFVVILILSFFLALGAAGLRRMGTGKSVAVVTSEALFDEARSTAIGNGTTSRVIIDANDPNDTDNYLRRMFIAYKQIDKDGKPTGSWIISPHS